MRNPMCRTAVYLAVFAANAGALLGHSPVVFAQSQALEEVVVTARKREESVQEVPIAISAFSGQQLQEAGVKNLEDMAQQVPGVSIDTGSIAQIWIRGVGQRDTSSRIDGPTGIYLDGVFLARKEGQLLDVFDTESMQVLRGPQGTLFGKNTTAGAILINTRKPTNDFGGRLETRIGNYNRRDAELMVNMPVVEDLLLSKITLASVKRDGYQTDLFDGSEMASEDRMAANLQVRWLPAESVTVDSFFYASRVREVAPGTLGQLLTKSGLNGQDSLFANSVWPGDTVPVWAFEGINAVSNSRGWADISPTYQATFDALRNAGDHDVASNAPTKFNVDNYLAGITVEWEINPNLSFKSITGYGYQRVGPQPVNSDNDGSPVNYQIQSPTHTSPREQISQEFQFTGDALDERLQYTAGLFVMQEDMEDDNNSLGALNGFIMPSQLSILPFDALVIPPAPTFRDDYDQKNNTWAAFFQASYDITEHIQATVGLRYTEEKREIELRRSGLDFARFANIIRGGLNIPGALIIDQGGALTILPTGPGGINALMAQDPIGRMQSLFRTLPSGYIDYPYLQPTKYTSKNTWENVSPMFSIKGNIPDEWLGDGFINSAMVYFTYSEGFKSGSFEAIGQEGLSKLDPETIDNFEVGVKLDAFDRSVRLNAAAYLMKYNDMQLLQVIPNEVTGPVVAFTNASESEIQGFEVEFNWLPTERMMVVAGASYNDYDFKKWEAIELSTANLYADPRVVNPAFLGSLPNPNVDRSSEAFPEVPSKTAFLALQYTFDIGVGTLTPRIQYNYTSERYMGLDPGAWGVRDQSTLDSYDRIDARLSFRSPDERFELTLYGTNLTDELYYEGAASVGDSVGLFPLSSAAPRMYGLELSYLFGEM